MVEKKYKDKAALVAELHDKLERATAVVLTEYRGLKAGDLVQLRRGLRESQVEVLVVKNTLLRRAAEGTRSESLVGELAGPTAIAVAYGEPTEAAKSLSKSAGDLEPFNLRYGLVEAMIVDEKGIAALAKLPGKAQLQAQAVGALQGPLSSFVGILQGVLTQFAGTLQAKIEKEGGAS